MTPNFEDYLQFGVVTCFRGWVDFESASSGQYSVMGFIFNLALFESI